MKKKIIVLALCLTILGGTAAFGMDKAVGGGVAWRSIEDLSGFGVSAFFGLGRFAEISAGFSRYEIDFGEWGSIDFITVQAGLYFKYPFPVSDKIVLFPTAGVEFEYDIEYEDTLVWFFGGAGLDFFLTDTMFLRGHVVLGQGMYDGEFFDALGTSFRLALGVMLP
jgi:hypothetical protein